MRGPEDVNTRQPSSPSSSAFNRRRVGQSLALHARDGFPKLPQVGFRPIDVAGALLFPLEQIEAVERSRMVNLPTTEAEAIAAKRRRGRPRKTEATAAYAPRDRNSNPAGRQPLSNTSAFDAR